MVIGKQIDYTDSEGMKHNIQEHGRNEITNLMNGSLRSFIPEAVYIDGKRWVEFDDMGMGDPTEQAKGWIEEQIKNRRPPPP